MAMMECTECKKQISDLAKSCPHCGAPASSKKGGGSIFIIIVAIVGLLIIIPAFLPSYDVTLMAAKGFSQQEAPPSAAPEVFTREHFKSLVMNRSPEQLLDVVGKPDSTSTNGDTQYWYYRGRTLDYVTGKVDNSAQVVIGRHNLVESVNF